LHLFSFFDVHDWQVWSFDGVAEFFHIPFTALKPFFFFLFLFCFSLISILSLSPEIPSSSCSSLLEWLSTIFFIWVKELFISRISVLLFFSEIFHIFVKLLFPYLVLSSLFHFSLSLSLFIISLVLFLSLLKCGVSNDLIICHQSFYRFYHLNTTIWGPD
jgi:hypothetical protein